MATAVSFPSATPALHPHHRHVIFRPNTHGRVYKFRCSGQNSTSNSSTKQDTEPQNVLLKMAWYSSELLGIAASFFRSPSNVGTSGDGLELSVDGSGVIDRAVVVDTIKEDFQRSYFVTGNLTLNAYEEDCEFADPAGSFRGLRRFKRNCTNFGSLVDKSDMKLTKWEDLEDKGIGHWRFSCVLSFPWKPILSDFIEWKTQVHEFMYADSLNTLSSLQLLDTLNTILMCKLEKCAGMWSTGMFLKWLYLSKF